MNKPTVIITHHSASPPRFTVDDVDIWHRKRWPNFYSELGYWVGYHYVIEQDGTVTQTRKHHEEGAHTIGMNNKSIGVCFMGNFDLTQPTKEQHKAWKKLYKRLSILYPEIPTVPHRYYSNKSCHGALLKDEHFSLVYQRLTLIDELNALIARLTRLLTQRRQSIHE